MPTHRRERYSENSTDGTTTDSYVRIVEWDVRDEDEKLVLIKNSGGSNSMDYRVYSKARWGGNIEYQEGTGTLTTGSVAKINVTGHTAALIVELKSTSAGNSTSYQIEYGGYIAR